MLIFVQKVRYYYTGPEILLIFYCLFPLTLIRFRVSQVKDIYGIAPYAELVHDEK